MSSDLMPLPALQVGEFPPFLTQDRFAALSGVPIGVVQGWLARGYLPTVRVGKRLLIDVVEFVRLSRIARDDFDGRIGHVC